MPRPSSNPEKARSGGGVEAGNYEVMGAKFQNIKTERKDTQTYGVLHCAVLDKDGDRVRDAENVDIQMGFGPKAIEFLHPGKAKDRNDSDPEDMGSSPDVEGNTVWCEEGAQFNRSCGYIVFTESLAKLGFPKSVLDETYADNFAGMKFELATLPAAEVNSLIGTRLNTKPLPDGGVVTYKIAKRWLNPNYMVGGGAVSNGTASSSAAPAESKSTDPKEIAKVIVGRVAAARKGPKNGIKSLQQFIGFATNENAKGKVSANKDFVEAKKILADEEWLGGALAEVGAEVSYNDEGKIAGIVFPE